VRCGAECVCSGVWDTSSGTPLHLFVDIKTDGVEALPYILKALEPLRERGARPASCVSGCALTATQAT
jgi:hypothetical protein